MQFDEGERGFSFQNNGPLDMRMDPTLQVSAKEAIRDLPEEELGLLFRDLGEERHWRKGAKAIVEARKKKKIETTHDLKEIIERALPRGGQKIHPATRIFQAIRIYINKELESVEGAIKKAIEVLSPGGRIGVISFHSLEDRIVKNVFRDATKPLKDLHGKITKDAVLKTLTKKPLIPTVQERRINRRSRSAKLRFAEKQ